MELWNKIPQFWRYVLIGCLSLVVSLAGVYWAVHKNSWADGGRGGALATIAGLCTLFLRPDYGLRIYEARKERIDPKLCKLDRLDQEVAAIVAAMRINSEGQTHLNRAVVIASLIGTLFWGFGDLLAKHIMGIH